MKEAKKDEWIGHLPGWNKEEVPVEGPRQVPNKGGLDGRKEGRKEGGNASKEGRKDIKDGKNDGQKGRTGPGFRP
jgi:hypothetical protein